MYHLYIYIPQFVRNRYKFKYKHTLILHRSSISTTEQKNKEDGIRI